MISKSQHKDKRPTSEQGQVTMAAEHYLIFVGLVLSFVLLQTSEAKSFNEDKWYGQNTVGKLKYKMKGMNHTCIVNCT